MSNAKTKVWRPVGVRAMAMVLAGFVGLIALPVMVGGSAAAVSPDQSHAGPVQATEYCLLLPESLIDVRYTRFESEIGWMSCSGVTRGTPVAGKPHEFRFLPKQKLTREAMAAFLFRVQQLKSTGDGSAFTPPTESPFADVNPGHPFYREIAWMHAAGIARGTAQPSGKPLYEPKRSLTREAMAAFLFRHQELQGPGNTAAGFVAPDAVAFGDVTPNAKFYREIAWMHHAGVSTGVRNGLRLEYQPKQSVTREAMAAFLYRLYAVPESDH